MSIESRIKKVIRRRLRLQTIHDLKAVSIGIEKGYLKFNGTGKDAILEVNKTGMELINYEY